ncbi:hypothetical protein [Plastoroseomonas hellenica]|uniref:hypothetical protein n=1 Tax=Plastoroseomonas hellenica TaxID=2687306 RepID=UPI001BA9AC2B|nr:hypothetical protein [Plastoroseomonas hellenica]MBR0642636.1 hypothetical protein [Plastoroseomonas hellenica]
MPFHSIRLAAELPGAARRVELCHDRAKTTVWLQLTNTGSVIGGGAGDGFVTALIGAVRKGNGWVAIDAGTAARCRDVTIAFGTKLGDQIAKFQSAITRDWASFNANSASRWAKGLTIGHDMSSPGFVMKAIKTGFDAINVSIPAYSGLRVKGFTVDEAIDYLQKRALSAGISVVDGGLMDFEEVAPDEDEIRFEDKASQTDERRVGLLLSTKARTHGGRFPYSAETASLPFERVIAYGFRGDSRPPGAIKNAGGFNPNYTRPDQIAKAVAAKQPMTQALDLPKFLENQFLGGYVSVSKSYAVAKAFATGQGGTTESAEDMRAGSIAASSKAASTSRLPASSRPRPGVPRSMCPATSRRSPCRGCWNGRMSWPAGRSTRPGGSRATSSCANPSSTMTTGVSGRTSGGR